MTVPVMLSIRGTQHYPGEEPDVITLSTEGTLEQQKDVWVISYEESELTGLAGVTTTFRVSPRGVVLKRTGKLQSQMIFIVGQRHDSLYQLDFGALMMTVEATHIESNLSEAGGTLDVHYTLSIEEAEAGMVEYHLDIKKMA